MAEYKSLFRTEVEYKLCFSRLCVSYTKWCNLLLNSITPRTVSRSFLDMFYYLRTPGS